MNGEQRRNIVNIEDLGKRLDEGFCTIDQHISQLKDRVVRLDMRLECIEAHVGKLREHFETSGVLEEPQEKD